MRRYKIPFRKENTRKRQKNAITGYLKVNNQTNMKNKSKFNIRSVPNEGKAVITFSENLEEAVMPALKQAFLFPVLLGEETRYKGSVELTIWLNEAEFEILDLLMDELGRRFGHNGKAENPLNN